MKNICKFGVWAIDPLVPQGSTGPISTVQVTPPRSTPRVAGFAGPIGSGYDLPTDDSDRTPGKRSDQPIEDSVRKFAQRAVRGVEIAIFEKGAAGKTPNLLPATCQLDRSLRRVTVRSEQGGLIAKQQKFLLQTASFSSWNDAPTNGGADKAVDMTPVVQDLKRIVCVLNETLDGVDEYNLVFSDRSQAEEFVSCITVLKLYAQLYLPKRASEAPLAPR